jgi:RNA polymerase sigma-70 factor (ECF subfamily)
MAIPGIRITLVDVNGAPAIVAWAGTEPLLTMSLVVTDGRVEQVLIVRNPDKLKGLGDGAPSHT